MIRKLNSVVGVLSILALISLIGLSAQASMVELRLGGGTSLSKPDLGSYYSGSYELPTAAPAIGFSADVIISPPLFSFGVGLRSESAKVSYDKSPLSVENKYSRTAIILNYRIVDTLVFFGPIATYGIGHSGGLKLAADGTNIIDINSTSTSSYSLGLEVGAHMLGFLVGAEAGYLDLRYKNATDSVSNISKDLNMSGNYVKLLCGLAF